MRTHWTAVAQKWLGHRWLPAGLALAAALMMLPALDAGLAMDDLLQRVFQLAPNQVPPVLRQTGFARESGTLRVVLSDLFGFKGEPQAIARARDYGLLPWWTRDDVKAALWRPLSALTHWMDYRAFPNSPALMHAHSIAWFACVVFVAALVYRQILGPGWVAGLAGLLFLLDKDTFFPVMFVANRGFVISLFFGLVCLYAHHQWRSTKRRRPAVLSVLALGASLLSNEAGVSTLAFLIAYALFLEPGPVPETEKVKAAGGRQWLKENGSRFVPVLPALATVIVWRVIYQASGHGVANVSVYLDPSQEPLSFLAELLPRSLFLLGGQLTGLPPEFALGLRPSLDRGALLVVCGVVTLVLLALLPLLQRERVARFWFVAMLLTLVPAATVVPLSKNMGFVAIAAFGLIAVFTSSVVARPNPAPGPAWSRRLALAVCTGLLLAHVPGAVAGRIAASRIAPSALHTMLRLGDIGDDAGIAGKDVVVLNASCSLALMGTPFTRFYRGQELPNTLRSLVPGCTGFLVQRTDARTLLVRPNGPNVFHFRDVGPLHVSYVLARIDQMFRRPAFKAGYHLGLNGLDIEVLETDAQGLPATAVFRFGASLDSPSFRWRYFDWASFRYRPLEIPAVGATAYVPGPREGQKTPRKWSWLKPQPVPAG